MRRLSFILISFIIASCSGQVSPLRQVNIFNGTDLAGNTYPGATTPFGAVQLSPDTDVASPSGYKWNKDRILGFSHTHLSGTGCPDLGDFLVTPGIGEVKPLEFSHSDEKAYPGYYSVKVPGIKAELTATPHTGVHRYTFRGKGERIIKIDGNHCVGGWCTPEEVSIRIEGNEIVGHRVVNGWAKHRNAYLSAVFSKPWLRAFEASTGVWLFFFPEDVDEIELYSGISGISQEGARHNREAEALPFEETLAKAESMWEDALGRIEVKGGPVDIFYTYFYHTFATPNLVSDEGAEKPSYSTFSLWDTFRAWHPLQTILDTKFVSDMIDSMLQMYRKWGELPIWPLADDETGCMIGYHSVPVIADAWLRGIRTFDGEEALQAMIVSSNKNNVNASELYTEYGWIPADLKIETVSQTLEFAYDDWCIARMAESLGHFDIAAEYDRRALSYREIFDPVTGFMRGKNTDGSFTEPFNQLTGSRDYTEATPWHYRFFVPHDMEGLKNLMGGQEKFLAALDSLFTFRPEGQKSVDGDIGGLLGQYAQGNEPGHNFPWLPCWAGAPSLSQWAVRELLTNAYSAAPDGICGNEDCGQMGAWYVLASLGIYPACPGTGEYILTAPLFREAVIKLSGGKTLTIKADRPDSRYIADVKLNGKDIDRNFVTYDEIMGGGELCFKLSETPCQERENLPAPYSLTKEAFVCPVAIDGNLSLFEDKTAVTLSSRTDGAEIRYTLDGSEPAEKSILYDGPFTIDKGCTIRARAFKEGMHSSVVTTRKAHKLFFQPSASRAGLKQGCRYTYHEANFKLVGQLEADPAEGSGTMAQPSIAGAKAEDHFGYVFSGYIDIPEDGIWKFATVSDDGSALYIDGMPVVNNDGSHSAVMAEGQIPLLKGLHPYKLLYFEDYEGQELSWKWKVPDASSFTDIPANVLYY